LRRIAQAEAEGLLQDGEFEYFSFAVRAWQANDGRWTEELAELLTFEGYKFLKLHGIQGLVHDTSSELEIPLGASCELGGCESRRSRLPEGG
jgi:hypothetical protein